MRNFAVIMLVGITLAQLNSGAAGTSKLTDAEGDELLEIIRAVNHATLPYKATVMQQMLAEANYFSDRLQLPMSRPIKMEEVRYSRVFDPWYSTIKGSNPPELPATSFGRDICNTNIPRELRLHALQIGVSGVLETTNFFFSFGSGKLLMVQRLSEHGVEYFARDLDKLVGKASLINVDGAYQLATQWLAMAGVEIVAVEGQFPHSVNQLHYRPHGGTNTLLLPIFYVGFGTNNAPKWQSVGYDPGVEVEILGTTKELQELVLHDAGFSRRPVLIITNALDLIRTPTLPLKQLTNSSPRVQTNRSSP